MKGRIPLVLGVALLTASCADTPYEPRNESLLVEQPQLASNVSRDQVIGHWEITFQGGYQGKYSANAIRHAEGSVSGEWELHEIEPNGNTGRVHGDVVCFTVLPDGRTARVGGIIESSTYPGLEGLAAVWLVQDNGEGRGATDFASDIRFGYPTGVEQDFCEFGFELFTFEPVERGNIQVRP